LPKFRRARMPARMTYPLARQIAAPLIRFN
jgi:hypothetical protein